MLLNVAGVDFEGGFYERSAEAILKIVQINVEATLRITHMILDHRAPGKTVLLNFCVEPCFLLPHAAQGDIRGVQSFLREFACALGQELKSQGVSVLSLCPGGLPTTSEAMSGIAAQGFWGEITTNRLERVTRITISRILKGRSIYIPGLVNRSIQMLGSLIPKTLIAKLVYSRWNSAQKEWLKV